MTTRTNGEVFYKEIGRTSNTAQSLYKNYPIYNKFISHTRYIGGEAQIGTDKYWKPFLSGNLNVYVVYNTNDEYSVQQPPLSQSQLADSMRYSALARSNCIPKVDDIGAGIGTGGNIVFGGSMYRKTSSYVPWSSISNKNETGVGSQNPYIGNSVAIWVKLGTVGATVETGQVYWWDRCAERFLVIPIIPISQMASPTQALFASIREGRILALMAGGMTRLAASVQIDNSIKSEAAGAGGKGGTGGKGGENGGSSSQGGGTKTSANIRTTVKVRGNFGYVGVGERSGNAPQMVQMYRQPNRTAPEVARHIFNPKPGQVSYSNLGSDWQDIERAGQIPLVDWKSYKLMTVSFQFVVVPSNSYRMGAFSENASDTEINLSIDDDLRNLRAMATRPFPVILYGFDDMLNVQLRYPESDKARGVEFVIADMTMSAVHRTVEGAINRATVDITLREIPLEAISLIEMPKLVPVTVKPPIKNGDIEYGERRLFTDDSNISLP